MTPRFHFFVSILLVLLLLTSMTVPVGANASPSPIFAAAPALVSVVCGNSTWVLAESSVVALGVILGMQWDTVVDHWGTFVADIGEGINGVFSTNKWVDASSDECKNLTQLEMVLYEGGGSSKPDPDEEKWYHEAKREDNTVKVNTQRLSEKGAVQKVTEGKDLFTLNEKHAKDVVEKMIRKEAERKGLSEDVIKDLIKNIQKPEIHKGGISGYYPHYHIETSGHRIHIWWHDAL